VKVLIIPEDPTLDGFVLYPVVERLCASQNIAARIEVLRDPHLRGVDQALNLKIINKIVEMNPMVDLFLLIVDLDCNRTKNRERAQVIATSHKTKLIACLAVNEVEVWMLALFDHDIQWQTIRAECDPKERYADPFLEERGWSAEVGRGRKRAMREIATNWNRLIQRCPEIRGLAEAIHSLQGA
jgi:hypothetical protein